MYDFSDCDLCENIMNQPIRKLSIWSFSQFFLDVFLARLTER